MRYFRSMKTFQHQSQQRKGLSHLFLGGRLLDSQLGRATVDVLRHTTDFCHLQYSNHGAVTKTNASSDKRRKKQCYGKAMG